MKFHKLAILLQCALICGAPISISLQCAAQNAVSQTSGTAFEVKAQNEIDQQDLAKLESFIAQLNACVAEAQSASLSAGGRNSNWELIKRLVLGIEFQQDKLQLSPLISRYQSRIKTDLNRLSPSAALNYQQDAKRWAKQKQQNLAHGEQQVDKLLYDRPQLARYLLRNDSLWKWLVRHFAGEALGGSKIFWDNTDPDGPGERIAEHSYEYQRPYSDNRLKINRPYRIPKGLVRVQSKGEDGSPLDGERTLSSVVFELLNMENAPGFENLLEETITGNVSKADFIRRATTLEYVAAQRRGLFFHTFLLPATSRKIPLTNAIWTISGPYSIWISRFDKHGYPYDSWGWIYTYYIPAARRHRLEFDAAVKQMREASERNRQQRELAK